MLTLGVLRLFYAFLKIKWKSRSSYKSLKEQGFIIEIPADCLPGSVNKRFYFSCAFLIDCF